MKGLIQTTLISSLLITSTLAANEYPIYQGTKKAKKANNYHYNTQRPENLRVLNIKYDLSQYEKNKKEASEFEFLKTHREVRTIKNESNRNYKPIRTHIIDSDYETRVSKVFMSTIDHEKETIMGLYNLTNYEYNQMAILAFGILGNESKFGASAKLPIKESLPVVVAVAKVIKRGYKGGNIFNTSNNSRGYTQIKRIPKRIKEHYKLEKRDLLKPAAAAVATMGFLAQSLPELRNRARKNPEVTEDNFYRYLHYIYMGAARQISKRTATPDRNIYYKNIKRYSSGLRIFEKQID